MKRRTSSPIPFGYKLIDETYLEPVEKELEALEKILPMVRSKSLSLREGALWLSHNTGRSITHQGLASIARG